MFLTLYPNRKHSCWPAAFHPAEPSAKSLSLVFPLNSHLPLQQILLAEIVVLPIVSPNCTACQLMPTSL